MDLQDLSNKIDKIDKKMNTFLNLFYVEGTYRCQSCKYEAPGYGIDVCNKPESPKYKQENPSGGCFLFEARL
jgi:hypothetical protein